MTCPQCSSQNPDVAQFCFRCGRALRGADASRHGRAHAYAVQPAENVTQFALISTILPHTNRRAANHYRWAMIGSALAVVVLTLAGLLPAAIVAAAFLVPVTYLVYLYDTNLWEEAPASVTVGLFLFTGLLSAVVSLVFFEWIFDGQLSTLLVTSAARGGIGTVPIWPLVLFAVILPIVAEVAKNVGPVWLASRPMFDDMIDGFTFGVASGTAYAAFETVIAFGAVFRSGVVQTTDNLGSWIVIVLNLMVVKSVIYGSATGIAVAAFSGRGAGHDGFKPRYVANLAFAIVANVLYWLGIRLLAFAPAGQALGLLWGVVIATILILRVRVMLQTALLEAAVEDAARQARPATATTDGGFCPECEMALLPDSLFCIVCGSSVRATSAPGRNHIRQSGTGSPSQVALERLFRLGRDATVAIIVVAVLALAGAGVLAGTLIDRPQVPLRPVDPADLPGTLGTTGAQGSALAAAAAFTPSGSALAGTLDGMALADAKRWVLAQPTSEAPSPIGTPTQGPGDTPGSVYSLADRAQFALVDQWGLVADDPSYPWALFAYDEIGDYVYTELGTTEPGSDAASVLLSAYDVLIGSSDFYSQLQTSPEGPTSLQPFGDLTGAAGLAYQGLFGDPQSAAEFYGNIIVAVHQDGTVLVVTIEVFPPEAWEERLDLVGPLLVPALESFAGAPLP